MRSISCGADSWMRRAGSLRWLATLIALILCSQTAFAQPIRFFCAWVSIDWDFRQPGRTCVGTDGVGYVWLSIPYYEPPWDWYFGQPPPISILKVCSAEGSGCGKAVFCSTDLDSYDCILSGDALALASGGLQGSIWLSAVPKQHWFPDLGEHGLLGGAGAGVSYDITWNDEAARSDTMTISAPPVNPWSGRVCPLIIVFVRCLNSQEVHVYVKSRCDFVYGETNPGGWTYDNSALTWRAEIQFETCPGDVRVEQRVVTYRDSSYDLSTDGRFNTADVLALELPIGSPSSGGLEGFDFDGDGQILADDVEVLSAFLAAGLDSGTFGDVDGNGRVTCSDLVAASASWGAIAGDANYVIELDADINGSLAASDEAAFEALTFYPDADVTLDSVVDFADYLMYLNWYGDSDPQADFDGDGVVDFTDYLAFMNAYASPVYC